MWPNRIADGNTRTSTPGIITDSKENEFEDSHTNNNTNKNILFQIDSNNSKNITQTSNMTDEFPMLDELDRLAKMSKFHSNGQLINHDWLDRMTLKEIQKSFKNEKETSKFFFLGIDFAQIKCDDTKFTVLYYEEVTFLKNHFILVYTLCEINITFFLF